MTRILVFVVVGFTLGVTISSGARMMMAPDPVEWVEPDGEGAASDSADSPSGGATTSSAAAATTPAPRSAVDGASRSDASAGGAADEPRRPVSVLPQGAPDVAAGTRGEDAPERDGPARLGKIFAAMDPRDAARVLEMLEDHEVRAILTHMSDRNAAAILGHFEPARAATLSRVVLGGEGK